MIIKNPSLKKQFLFLIVVFAIFYFLGSDRFDVMDALQGALIYLITNIAFYYETKGVPFFLKIHIEDPYLKDRLSTLKKDRKRIKSILDEFKVVMKVVVIISLLVLILILIVFMDGLEGEINGIYHLLLTISTLLYLRHVIPIMVNNSIEKLDSTIDSIEE